MPTTYNKIATTTLSSAQSTVTFTSVDQSYTDLVVVVSGIMSSGGTAGIILYFNNDTGTTYSADQLDGNGSSGACYRDTNSNGMNLGILSGGNQGNTIFHIMNYSNSTTNKSVLARGNNGTGYVRLAIGCWRNTAAINRLDFNNPSTTFASGTTFTIYGVKAA